MSFSSSLSLGKHGTMLAQVTSLLGPFDGVVLVLKRCVSGTEPPASTVDLVAGRSIPTIQKLCALQYCHRILWTSAVPEDFWYRERVPISQDLTVGSGCPVALSWEGVTGTSLVSTDSTDKVALCLHRDHRAYILR